MKKKLAVILTSIMLVTATGCSYLSDPLSGGSDTGKSAEAADNPDQEASSNASSAESSDAGEESSAAAESTLDSSASEEMSGGADADSSQTDSSQTDSSQSDAGSEGSTEAKAAAEGDINPDEVTEPEIADEVISEPVDEKVVEQMTSADTEKEKDTTYDIVFMGDSQFDNARGTGSEIPAYTCSLIDNCKYYNLAIGGTAASVERSSGTEPSQIGTACFLSTCYALSGQITDIDTIFGQYPACEEIKKVDPSKVDCYVIEYGANDYINGAQTYNTDSNYDVHTYLGALSVGINTLRSISPDALIILCGPSYCMWYNGTGYVMGDSYTVDKGAGTLAEYADAASHLAESEGIMYIDTMYATWFDLKITTADSYLMDGLHYNERGRQIYAKTLSHFIKKLSGHDEGELGYIEINNFTFG